MNWDKNYLIRQKRKEIIMVIVYMYHKISDAQHNCSLSSNWCPASLWAVTALWPALPVYSSAWCHMVWNIPLASLGQLFWFCLLPAPWITTPSCQDNMRSWNIFGCVQHCSAAAKTSLCYQHCSFHKAKSSHHTIQCEEKQLCSSWN